jgi:hypothetical protein
MGAGLAVRADASLQCARLLTAAEVAAAAGPGFKAVGQEEPAAGKSECVWLLESANPKAISLTYSQRSAVPSGDLAQFFEAQAKRAEQLHENKREALDGVGAKAFLVPGKKPGAMAILIVQTSDGVAYAETDQLERAELLRLAKAIAAP